MPWQVDNPILVPFDFSDYSKASVIRALEVADQNSTQIHVLHVLPFLIPAEPGVVWGTVDDASRIEHAKESLRNALPAEKFGELQLEVRLGDPGTVTAQRAEELNADMVIMGSHGRTGLSRLVLGSVAERVARLAPCPVMILKLRQDEDLAPSGEAQEKVAVER